MALRFDDASPALLSSTLRAVRGFGFDRMTPVQSAVIPLFLQNKDVAVEAVTGSGKTLAFLIPIVERLKRLKTPLASTQVGAIIISPTRELATQTHDVLQRLTREGDDGSCGCILQSIVLRGGRPLEEDMASIASTGCNVIVATPGRLLDVMQRGEDAARTASAEQAAKLPVWTSLEVLVLDEADRLLNMGFQEALDQILQRLPKQRRTGLFSATQTREVKALARAGMRNPVTVRVRVQNDATAASLGGTQRIPARLNNVYVTCREDDKPRQLVRFLQSCAVESAERLAAGKKEGIKAVVFFLTCASVDFHATVLPPLVKYGAADVIRRLQHSGTTAARQLLPRSGTGPLSQQHRAKRPRPGTEEALHGEAAAVACAGVAEPSSSSGSSASPSAWSALDGLAQPSTATEAVAMASPASLPLFALHGKMEPKRRTAALEAFRDARAGVLLCTDVAARGIDVPDVDWIVQFDPPSDPSFFVHRIGRTARAGREGAALVLLLPAEKGYVDLLREVHRVPLVRRESAVGLVRDESAPETDAEAAGEAAAALSASPPSCSASTASAPGVDVAAGRSAAAADDAVPPEAEGVWDLLDAGDAAASAQHDGSKAERNTLCRAMRLLSARDRDVMEKGTKAFVAFARGYAEHALTYVFRFDELDVPRLAKGLGLLKLPSVKEFRGLPRTSLAYQVRAEDVGLPAIPVHPGAAAAAEAAGVVPVAAPDTSKVVFLDKARERARLLKAQREAENVSQAALALGLGQGLGDGLMMAGKGLKAAVTKAKKLAKRQAAETQEERMRKRKSRSTKIYEEWDELAREERLARRLRQGKITAEQYDTFLTDHGAEWEERATQNDGEDVASDGHEVESDEGDTAGEDMSGKRSRRKAVSDAGHAASRAPFVAKPEGFRTAMRRGGFAALLQSKQQHQQCVAATAQVATPGTGSSSSSQPPSQLPGTTASASLLPSGPSANAVTAEVVLRSAGLPQRIDLSTATARSAHKGQIVSRATQNSRKQASKASKSKARYVAARSGTKFGRTGKTKGRGGGGGGGGKGGKRK